MVYWVMRAESFAAVRTHSSRRECFLHVMEVTMRSDSKSEGRAGNFCQKLFHTKNVHVRQHHPNRLLDKWKDSYHRTTLFSANVYLRANRELML